MTPLSFFEEHSSNAMSWSAQRAAAVTRLDAFAPRAGKAYASSRNYDLGPNNRGNISCLSPWIKHRLLREEEVLRKILSRHSITGAEKFIQEVFWRAYFKGWLEQHPSVWTAYLSDLAELRDELDRSHALRDRYQTAISGQTGIGCFDAWAIELAQTGYLHNHARMWFASIWIFTLRLPWHLGADFFMHHLLDGDAAANTLSWRWVAGLHTKGKTYLARAENIEKYTNARFSPLGLASHASPLVETGEHLQASLPKREALDTKQTYGLIITPEDCHTESLPLESKPAALLSLYEPNRKSQLVRAFTKNALEDATARAQTHFGCAAKQSGQLNTGETLIKFARAHDLKTLATAQLPIGSMRDEMNAAMPALQQAGIELIQITRPYDQACWPHANKGFFKLKAKIPNILKELELI